MTELFIFVELTRSCQNNSKFMKKNENDALYKFKNYMYIIGDRLDHDNVVV